MAFPIALPLVTSDLIHLQLTYTIVHDLREQFAARPGARFLLDMEHCPKIDPGGILMLKSELDRGVHVHDVKVHARWPRSRAARVGVALIGFGSENHQNAADRTETEQTASAVNDAPGTAVAISSGAKGEATGALTFEAARLAEQLGDAILADRIHAALNEAADNVLSWAYQEPPADLPSIAQRWWALGLLSRTEQSAFIALDHGATIPSTAPRVLGDKLALFFDELRKKGRAVISAERTDADALQATISYKRSQSGKGERGKGLTSMIALIDLLAAGEIVIISGDAIFGYRRASAKIAPVEFCRPLGWRFDGTMIIWFVGGASRLSE